jgi:hypothetical protein
MRHTAFGLDAGEAYVDLSCIRVCRSACVSFTLAVLMLQNMCIRVCAEVSTERRVSWAAGHFGDTVVGHLLQDVPELHGIAPHVLLALLWASLVSSPTSCS